MQITKQEYKTIGELLSSISVPVKDAPYVINLINKCFELSKDVVDEEKKE